MTEAAVEASPSSVPGAVLRFLREKVLFWLPVAPLIALDLWSKAAAFAFLERTQPTTPEHLRHHAVWGVGAPVEFALVSWRNKGTIWGLGTSYTDVLIALRVLALGLIVYFVNRVPAKARLHHLVLGMIMAGAIGNLYDNLTQVRGGVRDFLLFSATIAGKEYDFPAFNVADSCICVGAITLAVLLWRGDAGERPVSESEA